jgi:hypothetical protein
MGIGRISMLGLIEFLEEIERNHQTVTIERREVERLVRRYGPTVRSIGKWDRGGSGTIEVPMGLIMRAVERLGDRTLAQAVSQLKNVEEGGHESGAAQDLIGVLAELYLEQFQSRVERFQASEDPEEVERLRGEISRELFGS